MCGSVYLVFDYRLRHRGLANHSSQPRPLLYLTYAKPFFADATNFSATRYPELPEGRDERSRKREQLSEKERRRPSAASPKAALPPGSDEQ
ncbi:hypothetical protein T492DRAFT_885058 [Pavlovales sp. CCMP2436]|nr:hypothetical protein T492DRAFT_885058 [Pavlovales sp. CCMP2436]